jgi:pilus assembly protein CpaB
MQVSGRREPGEVRRFAARHRPVLTALLLGLSVLAAISAVRADRSGVAVVVAAHDLAPGTVLTAGDLATTRLPAAAVPAGTVPTRAAATGRMLAGALRRGESVTDVRLVGRALLARLPPGHVAVSVTTSDPNVSVLVQPGDHVDVVATATDAGSSESAAARPSGPRLLASDALVLSVPAPARSGGGVLGGSSNPETSGAVILAVTRGQGGTIVAAAADAPLAVLLESGAGGS